MRTGVNLRSIVLLSLATMCIGVPVDGRASAQRLGQSGEWELHVMEDPFANPKRVCVVQSTYEGPSGGRRTRPRFRVFLGTSMLFIDPTIKMTHAIRLYRKIVNTRESYDVERFIPDNKLRHRLRVDEGEVYTVDVQDPEFDSWAVHDSVRDTPVLIGAMGRGTSLYYQWDMGQASETFEFELKGFAAMVKEAENSCR